MGQFRITVNGVGGHGCERRALPGEKLHGRCQKLTCVDCLTYDFVQLLKQKGFMIQSAALTHFPDSTQEVIDDLLHNQRREGTF